MTNTSIRTLPAEIINLIAAGEVIDSLAAVVRELVENALDAGANRLVIAIFPDLWRVQVSDNGQGMSLDDVRVCAKAHSTSKIYQLSDLWQITSLGFRGEALHSIAQVADLEIWSRTSTEVAAGWRVSYRQGQVIEEATVAIAPGTIVNVSHIFGNIPVRRQSLPAPKQQLKAIQTIIQHFALCYPQVTWQVLNNNQSWLNISPSTNPQQILPQILNQVHPTDLQFLSVDIAAEGEGDGATRGWGDKSIDNDLIIGFKAKIANLKSKIEITLGLPDRCHRPKRDWIKIAVNGRMINNSELEQTIINSFARTLPRDRYPVCFLHLQIPPHQIDWNRHPAKTEIYLQNLDFWCDKVAQAIEKALHLTNADISQQSNQRVTQLLKASENKGNYRFNRQITTNNYDPEQLSLLELTAVAQILNTYIIAEHRNGLWLVEQHIAHERVLYEQLQDNWQIIPLETPIILKDLTLDQIEQLQRLNLEIAEFGEQMWKISHAPLMLAHREDCQEALIELSWGGDLEEAQVATACRSAIRNGKPLKMDEMQQLLNQWQQTRNPRTCPHGRPIYLPLEESSLARFFRRHWVIGKSHGI